MSKKTTPDEAEQVEVSELIEDLDEAVPDEEIKPDPVPGDADYDWAQLYPKGADLYVHRYPDGQTVGLRTFRAIYSKQWLASIADLPTEFDVERAAFARGGCDEAARIIRSRPAPIDGPDDFQALWDAWTAHSNDGEAVTPGE